MDSIHIFYFVQNTISLPRSDVALLIIIIILCISVCMSVFSLNHVFIMYFMISNGGKKEH